MYIPKHNLETDEGTIRRLVRAHSFGMLIVAREDGEIEITHLPFILDDGDRLRVHVARANPVWREVLSEKRRGDIIVVFHGPHGYVSPTCYEHSKKDVPTWNYAVVHAHVSAPALMEREELLGLLEDLARENETGPAPWQLDEHPADSRERLVQAIVGLNLPVSRWEAKLKLSQNRNDTDHANVVAAFEKRGTPDDLEMALLMRAAAR